MTATKSESVMMMVELHAGYGDGFAEVEFRDGRPVVLPASRGEYGCQPAGIALRDAGVRTVGVPIKRIVGPVGGAAAARIRAKRFTKNWASNTFLDSATDDEVLAAMSRDECRDTLAAVNALEAKYS